MRHLNMSEHKINCKEVMAHICDNLGEDLNSPKCVAIKEHLENCPSCSSYLKSIDTTIKFYKKYNEKLSEKSHNKLFDILGLSDEECK
jgi:hypothetical protein